MGSKDDMTNVATWLFLKILSGVQFHRTMKLILNVINLIKVQCAICRPEYLLQKKSHGQDDKITGQLYLSKSIPNVRFNLSCQDILYYVKIKPDLNR